MTVYNEPRFLQNSIHFLTKLNVAQLSLHPYHVKMNLKSIEIWTNSTFQTQDILLYVQLRLIHTHSVHSISDSTVITLIQTQSMHSFLYRLFDDDITPYLTSHIIQY